MAVATRLPSDGEYIVLGNFEDLPNAEIWRDKSASQVIINAVSGDAFNFAIGDTSEMTLDGTNLTVVGSHVVVTAGNITATAGNIQATAGNLIAPAGNASLGNPGSFATTQPTGAVVMGGSSLGGTAPVGAITTAGAVFASDTVVRKIIAAGTASNVET